LVVGAVLVPLTLFRIQIRKPMVKKVAIAMVLEEMVKVFDTNGNGA
jgi:hypothetical protein